VRVLFLTHRLPYAANRGDRIRALYILRQLVGRADVDLVSLVHSDEEAGHAGDLHELAATVTVARVPRLKNYARGAAALVMGRPLTHALLDAPTIRTACRRLVTAHPPDVVLAYCSSMARFALEPPLDRFPFVLDMVDVDSEKWRTLGRTAAVPKCWIYAAEARTLSGFEARAARTARAVLVVNERERDLIVGLEPDANVHVLPIGVAVDELRPTGAPATGRGVVFCGVMNYRLNEEGALWFARAVWPLVRTRCPDARLSLVGSDPTSAIRELSARDSTIEVTGTVPDVRPYLWRSAVAIAPLPSARGVQNKVLEAVAAGLPCVVTPAVHDGLPAEVIPACIRAQDAEQFAGAVVDLLNRDPAGRRAVAERANVRALSWNERLAPLVGILERAARAPASPLPRTDVA
jgi:sugar transferase (PEP-CTERM/EpsH1 system associated)